MVENMTENILMIKNMVLEPTLGKMDDNTKVNGLMGNNTVMVYIVMLMAKNVVVNGKKVKELNGSIQTRILKNSSEKLRNYHK